MVTAEGRLKPKPHSEGPYSRVIIESVSPEVDGGRFPIKRTVGEEIVVSADIFADGHDMIVAVLRHRSVGANVWTEVPMSLATNDRWTGRFTVTSQGWHEYTIEAWVDRFASWSKELSKKYEAGQQELTSELLEGAALVGKGAGRATGLDADWLVQRAEVLRGTTSHAERVQLALEPELAERMARFPDRGGACGYDRTLRIMVERQRARFGAWYEMFPRSASTDRGRHGTLRDVVARLPYVAGMGFDVLYLPPIHPIGRAFRKGPNNTLMPGPNDPGSPWAIGGPEGGHKAIHPELGTLDDFDHLVSRAKEMGLEIVLDIAFQCSPDHPYVREHPEWFRHRPDGTIKYAENPPKKYQDIYPLDFECDDWNALWNELRDVFLFWIDHGVLIFRVDNPHTKPFRFWDWVIDEVWDRHPDMIFLSEAFTRPKVMRQLAKGGYLAVVHLLHLAEHQAGADRVLHRADADARSRGVHASQSVRQHARHPARVPPVRRPPRVHDPARPGRHPGRRATAFTARRSSTASAPRYDRVRKNISTRRSIRSPTGTSKSRGACAITLLGSMKFAGTTPRCIATAICGFSKSTTNP